MTDLRFRLRKYPLRLRRSFTTSKQSTSGKETLFARYGHGIGEGSSSVHYGPTAAELIPLTQELLDQREPLRGSAAVDAFLTELPGYLKTARCALEMAFLDHVAVEENIPLYELLKLQRPQVIVSSVTITQGDSDEIRAQVEQFSDFSTFKLKVGFEGDLELIENVLKCREVKLRLDANGGWSTDDAVERLRSLAGYPIEFVEQPIDEPTVRELDKIKTKVECSLFLDESIQKEDDIERFYPVIDGVSLKLAKCGGIRETLKLVDRARERGLKLLLGCMLESSVGISAGCHISSLFDYLDLDSILLIENDPAWGAQFSGERLLLPEGAGLGLVREELKLA